MKNNVPYLWDLAENQIKYAGPRDKTINVKIAINTAKMMVERERSAPDLLEACREVWCHWKGKDLSPLQKLTFDRICAAIDRTDGGGE